MPLTQPFNEYLDFNAAKDNGAAGDGVTDDKVAIETTAAAGAVYLDPGAYLYTGSLGSIRTNGEGVLKSGSNLHARLFSQMTTPPSSYGNDSSVVTAFSGDMSRVILPMEHRVTGADTLGHPSDPDYFQNPETAAQYIYTYVAPTAGQNELLDWTGGRTGVASIHIKGDHFGQGDYSALTIGVGAFNNKPTGTHFLSQPAANAINGGVAGYADHVNIVVTEFTVDDNGYDINGTGHTVQMARTNDTGSQEAFWRGFSVNSRGNKNIDAAFTGRGNIRRGFDISLATLAAEQAAIVLAADQRFYGAATKKNSASATGAGAGQKVWDAYGSAWFRYGSGTSAWDFNNPINLISGNVLRVNNVQVVGARDTGWAAMTGTPDEGSVYATGSVTLPQLAGRVMALQAALTTHGLIGT